MEENKIVNEVSESWTVDGYGNESFRGKEGGITLDELAAEADVEDME